MIFPGQPKSSQDEEMVSEDLDDILDPSPHLIGSVNSLDSAVSHAVDACAQALEFGSRLLENTLKCPPNSPGKSSLSIYIPRFRRPHNSRNAPVISPAIKDPPESIPFRPKDVPSVFIRNREARNALVIEDEFLTRLGGPLTPTEQVSQECKLPIVRKVYRIN